MADPIADEIGNVLATTPAPPAEQAAPAPSVDPIVSEINDALAGKTAAPAPAKPEPSTGSVIGSTLVSGAARGVGTIGDLPVGFANAMAGWARSQPDEVKYILGLESNDEYIKSVKNIVEHPMINPSSVPMTSSWLEKKAGEAGLPTVSNTVPSSPLERGLQQAGATALGFATPGAVAKLPHMGAAEALMPGSPIANAAIGAGVGATGEAVAQTAGEQYRPLGEAGAGLAGAGMAAGLSGAAGAARHGYQALAPDTSEAAAQTAAVRKLGAAATDPDAAAAALRQPLTEGMTAPEAAQDPGLLAAQAAREKASPEFASVLGQQRAGAIQNMAPQGVGPEETQSYLRKVLTGLDQKANTEIGDAQQRADVARAAAQPTMTPEEHGSAVEQAVQAERQPLTDTLTEAHDEASQELQGAFGKIGGIEAMGPPEERAAAPAALGAAMRDPTAKALADERSRLSDVRAAIDPSGSMGMSPAGIKEALVNIGTKFAPDTFGSMEKNFYNRVGGWGDIIPIEDAFRLRADINGRLRNVADHNPQEALRLQTLKSGIDQSLDDAATGIHQAEQSGVFQNTTPLADRVASAADDHLGPEFAPGANVLRPTTSDPLGSAIANRRTKTPSAGDSGTAPQGDGAASPQVSELENNVGNQGVPPGAGQRGGPTAPLEIPHGGAGTQPGGTPGGATQLVPLTPEARQRFDDWKQQYGEMKQTYSGQTAGQLHAVGKMLQKGGAYDSFRLRDDEVPWLFDRKNVPPEAIDRFIAAAPAEAHDALDNTFAFSLRRDAQNPDGTLNLPKYNQWLAGRQDALTRRPELLQKFGDVAQAQQRLNEVNDSLAKHAADYPLKPGWGYAGIMRQYWKPGPLGGESMRNFLQMTGNRPEAVQAAADYAAYDFANRPGIIKNGAINQGAAETWIRQHQAALSTVPGLDQRFYNAAAAQKTLESTITQHQNLRDGFTKSVAGTFMQDDPERAISRVFSGNNRGQKAQQLMSFTAHSPEAQDGIRRATVDHVLNILQNTPNQFSKFIDANRDVLNTILPGRTKLLDAISDSMRTPAAPAPVTTGHGTSQVSQFITYEVGGEIVGHFLHMLTGIPGAKQIAGLAVTAGKHMLEGASHGANQALDIKANKLFDQMLLDPKLAADALDTYRSVQSAKNPHPIQQRFLGRLIGQTIQNSMNTDINQPNKRFKSGGHVNQQLLAA